MDFWRLHRRLMAFFALFALLYPSLIQAAGLGIDMVRTSPSALEVHSSPNLPVDVQAMESATLSQLFDRDTQTEYTAFEAQSVDVNLPKERKVTALRVFGAAPYQLSVQETTTNGWRDIQGLKGLDLTQLPDTWHTFSTNNAVKTGKLRLVLTPAASSASGLKEIEFWSEGEHIPVETGSQLLALLQNNDMQDQALLATASPASGTIGSIDETVLDDPTDNTFSLELDVPASQVKYAWLVYDAIGVGHWASAVRVINDQPALGGVVIEANDAWSEQIERISPVWLKKGTNRIRFTTTGENDYQYQVRNVRLIVELDNGANFVNYIGASSTEDSNVIDRLYDGSADTGMVVYSGDSIGTFNASDSNVTIPPGLINNPGNGLHLGWIKGKAPWKQALQGDPANADASTLEMGFDRGVELESVGFYLRGKLAGKIDVALFHDGNWQLGGSKSVSAQALKTGWNEIPVASGNKVQGVRLIFTGGEGSGGEIRELTVRGSGIGGAWLPPEVVVTYPDAGQFYGREAYVRGFLQGLRNASGEAQLFIGGKPVNHVNGEFQTLISKDDVGLESQADDVAWFVDAEAVYPDGSRTSTRVPLFVNRGPLGDAEADLAPVTPVVIPPGGVTGGIPGAGIVVGEGAVNEDLDITMMPLNDIDLAALDTWMTNVTGPNNGYRFLPHGKHFNKKIEVRIKYQPSLLPPGFSEDDIKTFYFDDQAGKWKELERKSIDKGKKEVVALTDHFTDMINAVIQVPDSPQNTQFNPTQIKDIKAADPGAKINLIEPPQANNMGDARLSYPIEVPPGRRGMQPQLAVQYSSGGGNGWMGQGWDLSVPSITVDTRWGVPRYSATNETETYLLNGEQLLPLIHRNDDIPRKKGKVEFHPRVEGAFQRIIRHGDKPENYWWEVTDKSGTTYFYGGDDTSEAPQPDATLATTTGNPGIGKWALVLVRDSNGNEMRYHYTRQLDSGLGNGAGNGGANGSVMGQQVYLDRINYTGYEGSDGRFDVIFERDRQLPEFNRNKDRRHDVTIDARLGLKQVTADLLKRIIVEYNKTPVRSYQLDYREGAYGKTLLNSVAQFSSQGQLFNTHTFDYYDDVRDGENYRPLASEAPWGVEDDGIDAGLLITKGDEYSGKASATSGTRSESSSKQVGGSVGFNDFYLGCKSNTFSGFRASNKSETEGMLALLDINGDGLPDKVFKDGSVIRFRAGAAEGKFDERHVNKLPVLKNLPGGEFYTDKSRTTSTGMQVMWGGCSKASLSAGVTTSNTVMESKSYFSDVNGDGLTDVVVNGRVYFNRIVNGTPTFSITSDGTPNEINANRELLADGILEGRTDEELAALEKQYPLHDTVKVWVAPFDGEVSISGSLKLINSPELLEYEDADGIRVAIQHEDEQLWDRIIEPEEAGNTVEPENVANIPVTRGELIYFRMQSVYDGNVDRLEWSPRVEYITDNADQLDANGNPVWAYDAQADYLLSGYPAQSTVMPFKGTVRVQGEINKLATTDDVRLTITRRGEQGEGPKEVIWSGELGREAETLTVDLSLDVEQDDGIAFTAEADTRIDWQALQWQPRVYYTSTPDSEIPLVDEDGLPTIEMWALPVNRLFTDVVIPAVAPVIIPQTVTVNEQEVPVPEGDVVNAKATVDMAFKGIELPFDKTQYIDGPLLLTVKKRDADGNVERLLKKEMTVWALNGRIAFPEDLQNYNPLRDDFPVPTVRFPVNPEEEYWFEFHSTEPAFAHMVKHGRVTVQLTNTTAEYQDEEGFWYNAEDELTWKFLNLGTKDTGFYTLWSDFRFGPLYRSWGQFAWRGEGDEAQALIDKDIIQQEYDKKSEGRDVSGFENIEESDDLVGAFESDGYDPANDRFILMVPDAENLRWSGFDDQSWLNATTMSSSRFGEDRFEEPSPVIEDQETGGPASAVVKIVKSDQTSYSFGASVNFGGGSGGGEGDDENPFKGGPGAGVGYSKGTSKSLLDFMDMNGDRYPDIVGQSKVQFTKPNGGLKENTESPANMGGIPRESSTESRTYNAGISAVISTPQNVQGGGKPDQVAKTYQASGGISGNAGSTSDDESIGLTDVNGDGLPDRVYRSGKVSLNLGYRFAQAESWGAVTRKGSSDMHGAGGNLGFDIGKLSISGGFALSRSDNQARKQLLDVNGDGLPDLVNTYRSLDGGMSVSLNSGGGFLPPVGWNKADAISESSSTNSEANFGATYCVPLVFPPMVAKVCGSASGSKGVGMSRETLTLQDINGDGYPDVLRSAHEGDLRVNLNTHRRTNLLKSVKRPLGASFEIDYQREGNTLAMPQSKWVMSQVLVNDGFAGDGVDNLLTTYGYKGGNYDRRERDFMGFAELSVEERKTEEGVPDLSEEMPPVYRSVQQHYLNGSVYERGFLVSSRMEDANGNPHTSSRKEYQFLNVETDELYEQGTDLSKVSFRIFPQLLEEESFFHEGEDAARKSTRQRFQAYDAYGNVSDFIDYGDEGAADDVSAKIEYDYDEDAWIMGAARSIAVSSNGIPLRYRSSSIEKGTGNVRSISQDYESGSAIYEFSYDKYGNLDEVTGPANYAGERYFLEYDYDGDVDTYVTYVKDSFGYESFAKYHPEWGEPKVTTDINGQSIDYTYDTVGRTRTIRAPKERAMGLNTISFEYYPQVEDSDPLSWALTRHYDPEHPLDHIETALFVDGLGRVIQTKKDGAVGDGSGEKPDDKMIVSGRIFFDHAGRAVKQYYPTTEDLGQAWLFNYAVDDVDPTTTEFDVLDRPLKVTTPDVNPDGLVTTFHYGFGYEKGNPAARFLTRVTDANGVSKESLRDVRQLVTAVKEYNNGGNEVIWTRYAYDPLKQITDVWDNLGNRTYAEYDQLGRRTLLSNPDTGTVEMEYDPASNLISKTTPNLREKGLSITYQYQYQRLSGITYPENPENNVAYTYGAPKAMYNGANRVIEVTDQAGYETRRYGMLGELTQSTRSIKWAAGPEEAYTTHYEYDTWNRLQKLTYPDGEVLTYGYNHGGLLETATGRKGSYDYHYVERIDYNKFEQRSYLRYGNQTETRYSYQKQNRRLEFLKAGKGDGNLFMDLSYRYDSVGNILGQANAATTNSPSQMGGKTEFSYGYDDLYRLTSSSGKFHTQPGKRHEYSLEMRYDTIHNITSKVQHDELFQPSGESVTQKKTSYNWSDDNNKQGYQYAGPQPHAPTHIGERAFSYDANGNQLGWTHDKNGTRRTITWDEENRIQQIHDNGHTLSYTYDASGQRITKRGPQGETGYINQWMTLRNGEVGTKHVFAGTTRVVSKLVKQDRPNTKRNSEDNPNSNGKGNGKARIVYEKDQYYFHPDHLGTTSYITHTNGQVYQHLEYFPFGETWVEEHSNKQRTPYLFTGKELDEETGLYYFGARYYDPRTSVWASPDPILGQYLSGSPANGVYSSNNLGLYSYGHNSPLGNVDPDGNWVLQVVGLAVTAYDAYENYQEGGWEAVGQGLAEDALVNIATGGLGKLGGKAIKAAAKTELGKQALESGKKAMDKAVVKARAKLDDATDSLTSRNKPCPLSFAPGTQVATPEGLVAIESLKVGDLVMSKNDVTGEVEARAVLATIETRHEHDVRLLTVKTMLGEEMVIVTSDEHPFYVSGTGWVEAGDLSVGDFLFTLAEKNLELLGSERLDDSMLMYNLTVDEFHTYSVTEEEVWVHNCGDVGEYGKVGGHHVHAKAAFKNSTVYDKRKGFSISQSFMKDNGLDHDAMTKFQRQAFKELAESGRANTMKEHSQIAVGALMAGGADRDLARSLVAESLSELRKSGVRTPTNIPWYK